MLECKQSQIPQFFQIQWQITPDVDLICPIFKLIQDFMGVHIVAKFGTDWSIFADARVFKVKYGKFLNSRADNSDSSGPIKSIIEFI